MVLIIKIVFDNFFANLLLICFVGINLSLSLLCISIFLAGRYLVSSLIVKLFPNSSLIERTSAQFIYFFIFIFFT